MDYLKYVNIKQGTNSVRRFSNGNTLPLVQLPFAMAGYSAQTEYDGGWFYNPTHRSLEGIRLTHQPSPWISDYGTFQGLCRQRMVKLPSGGRSYDTDIYEIPFSSFED